MAWKLAPALVKLRDQINVAHPQRSKKSDGSVGDLSHRARKSDHNPNHSGIVCAIDITHDPQHGFDAGKFADHLRTTRDPRIGYVISNRRIFSSTVAPWTWRKYSGSNPHTQHVHVSCKQSPGSWNSTGIWNIKPAPRAPMAGLMSMEEEEPPPTETADLTEDGFGRCFYEDLELNDATEGQDEQGDPAA